MLHGLSDWCGDARPEPFGEQLRQVVGELGEPVQLRPAAGDMKPVAAAPERRLHGMELGPSLDAFTVEFGSLGEDIQDATDSLARVVRFAERQCAGLQ